jgi:hypothetical protein
VLLLNRQDLIHQGAGYSDPNLRFFTYFDLNSIKRKAESTNPEPRLNKNRLLKIDEIKKVKLLNAKADQSTLHPPKLKKVVAPKRCKNPFCDHPKRLWYRVDVHQRRCFMRNSS